MYCNGPGHSGYGPARVGFEDVGSNGSVPIDLGPYKNATQVGIWHSHPPHSTVDTTGGHARDVANFHTQYRWLDHESFTVYTTLDSGLQMQFYVSQPIVEDLVEHDQDVPPSQVP